MFKTWCDLRVFAPGEWVVLKDFAWKSADAHVIVPRGFVTDLASVPRPLRGLLDVTGRSREPAVLHDWLYCRQEYSAGTPITRDQADDLFRRALADCGVGWMARNIYWLGVRIGGCLYWDKRAAAPLNADDFAPESALMDARSGG